MADETESVVDVPNNMTISRKEKPEIEINFEKFEDIKVFDEWGRRFRFGDIYKEKKTIVIFIRVSNRSVSNGFWHAAVQLEDRSELNAWV